MKITITRSFSRTKQVAAFEPINAFCSAQAEFETDHKSLAGGLLEKMYDFSSAELDRFCRTEVEKTIEAEIAKRRPVDKQKIKDTAKVEAELDAGAGSGYHEIN